MKISMVIAQEVNFIETDNKMMRKLTRCLVCLAAPAGVRCPEIVAFLIYQSMPSILLRYINIGMIAGRRLYLHNNLLQNTSSVILGEHNP